MDILKKLSDAMDENPEVTIVSSFIFAVVVGTIIAIFVL